MDSLSPFPLCILEIPPALRDLSCSSAVSSASRDLHSLKNEKPVRDNSPLTTRSVHKAGQALHTLR